MKLTDEQKEVIRSILNFSNQVQTLGGYAGTGKSVVVTHLHKILNGKFAVCAFTGKAANVLRQRNLPASTIHSLIYKPELDENGQIVLIDGRPSFILNPSLGYDGIIIDEASMVSQELYDDLQSFGVPLIFVGDHGQLEPIGEGVNLMQSPDYTLTTIHRNAGEIAHFAEWIRKGYRPGAFQFQDACKGKVQFMSSGEADRYIDKVDQIICAFNRSRVEMNKKVRKKLGFSDTLPEEGERIICLRNNKDRALFNGMQGTVVGRKGKNRMTFKSDELEYEVRFDVHQFNREKHDIPLDRADPDPFDFAYCITCHKSQGSEYPKVMVIEQRCRGWDHKRWAYTAASRAKESLLWVGA